MRITEATGRDLDDVLSVEGAAFTEEDVAALVRELADDPSARPLLSLLARDDRRALGRILFTAARLDGASRDVTVSILAPLAVVPDAQRRGIGGRLIEYGVRLLGESGVGAVSCSGTPATTPVTDSSRPAVTASCRRTRSHRMRRGWSGGCVRGSSGASAGPSGAPMRWTGRSTGGSSGNGPARVPGAYREGCPEGRRIGGYGVADEER